MLIGMAYARTWTQLEAHLPTGWSEARVSLRVEDESQLARAGAILGPLNPGRIENGVVFRLVAGGGTHGHEAVKRLLARLAVERISYVMQLLDSAEGPAPVAAANVSAAPDLLVAAWDAALVTLPADWSDVYGEVEIASSDLLDRAALLLGPVNPKRNIEKSAFRFRSAQVHGYGASAGMVRRCLERLDDDGITGTVTILRALCETRPVETQGPQWVEGGKHF